MATPKTAFGFRIPPALKLEIEKAAAFEDLSQTAYVISAINDRLEKTYQRQLTKEKASNHE